jgi:hypothetical protein
MNAEQIGGNRTTGSKKKAAARAGRSRPVINGIDASRGETAAMRLAEIIQGG